MPAKREIRCEACGTVNRVPQYSFRRIPSCGNCHQSLPEDLWIKAVREAYRRWRPAYIALPASALLALFTWVAIWSQPSAKHASAPVAVDACAGRPQPTEGIYRWYGPLWGDDIAELTITTAYGSNYFIRLTDMLDRRARAYFLRGGSTRSFNVPLGTFKLKYATGNNWCGEQQLFGNDTIYSKAADTFTFEQPPGYYPTHWTVELVLQRHGNLRTHRITRAEFDGRP